MPYYDEWEQDLAIKLGLLKPVKKEDDDSKEADDE